MGSIAMSEEFLNPTNIRVVGIGGAGCNTVNRMIEAGFQGVDFIALNTDVQSINISQANHKIQIGAQLTKGLGTGANVELGREAALESKDAIREALSGAHIVFITAGMGGGTGTGASPIVAEIARELGILTMAFVTYPFEFEGKRRSEQADQGIKKLEESVDSLLVIQNQKLMEALDDKNISLIQAFGRVDTILVQGIQGITDIINKTGIVNVDFADVLVIMKDGGYTLMGFGLASGKDRALNAVKIAVGNPLLDLDISGANGILVNISAGKTLSLVEYHQIVEYITTKISENANIIAGAYIDEEFGEQISVTVIATKFSDIRNSAKKSAAPTLSEGSSNEIIGKHGLIEEPIVLQQDAETREDSETALMDEEETIFGKQLHPIHRNKVYKNPSSFERKKVNAKDSKSDNVFLSKRESIKIFGEDFQIGKLDVPAFQRRGM